MTNEFGQFSLRLDRYPDTLVVSRIGSRPDTVAIDIRSAAELRIGLSVAPVILSDIIVSAPPAEGGPIGAGRWEIPLRSIQGAPPAVEPDVFRALSLVPSVSFSSPLSARPIIRGYDASESVVRIDGYEVTSPYHLGRVFSAFPAEAADAVVVSAGGAAADVGGTLAGTIDVTGRRVLDRGTSGGADLSLISATGWGGAADSGRQFLAAGRVVHLSAANLVSKQAIPYGFQDGYASARLSRPGGPSGQITVFGSHDRLFDPDLGSGMSWTNVLLGSRWQLLNRGASTASVSAAGTSFAEDVTDFPARYSRIDVRNRFASIQSGAEFLSRFRTSRLRLGATARWRVVDNRIVPRAGMDFGPTDVRVRRMEGAGFGEWRADFRRASLELGLRVDATQGASAWQPRVRFGSAIGANAVVGATVGRSSRLYQIVSDPLSEPDLAFYDFWLPSGTGGTPVPSVDHASIDLDVTHRLGRTRLSLFASRGRNLMELQPLSSPSNGGSPFRTGASRTAGIEFHTAFAPRGPRSPQVALTYVLSVSQRRWDGDWIPWSLDRRHLLRLTTEVAATERLRLSAVVEAASAAPLTPVIGVALRGFPDPQGGGVGHSPPQPVYIYGDENRLRGKGTARLDAAATWRFQGPWRSRMYLGLSVINLGFGPVSPLRPSAPAFAPSPGGGPATGRVTYERLFALPPIPTLTLRAEF